MSGSPAAPQEGRFNGIRLRERYGRILLLMVVGYVLAGFDDGTLVRLGSALVWMLLLFTALWAPGLPDQLRRVGIGVGAAIVVAVVVLIATDSDTARVAVFVVLGFAQLMALVAILARISRHERVGPQTVMGGVAGYALIGFAFAAFYGGFDIATDGGFLNGVVDSGDYIYFSFVTLTTVGYGDITAASDLAKRLVVIEAFGGQIFLITLVARLVSLWGMPLRRGAQP